MIVPFRSLSRGIIWAWPTFHPLFFCLELVFEVLWVDHRQPCLAALMRSLRPSAMRRPCFRPRKYRYADRAAEQTGNGVQGQELPAIDVIQESLDSPKVSLDNAAFLALQ